MVQPGNALTSHGHTKIECLVPEGEGVLQPVLVNVTGSQGDDRISTENGGAVLFYSYDPPTVTLITPSVIPTGVCGAALLWCC